MSIAFLSKSRRRYATLSMSAKPAVLSSQYASEARADWSTARTVEDGAKVIGSRGLLAREVKAAVAAVVLVHEHDFLAVLDGRPQLQLMAYTEQRGCKVRQACERGSGRSTCT